MELSAISTQSRFQPRHPADDEIFYPSTDPNAIPKTDIHFTLIANLVLMLETFFQNREDVHVSGDLMFYYEKGEPRKFVAPDVMVCFGVGKEPRLNPETNEFLMTMEEMAAELARLKQQS